MEEEGRLQTGLFLEAHFHALTAKGIPYYIINKGAYASGTILLKINMLGQGFKLLTQQRNLDGVMQWVDALPQALSYEREVDRYIQKNLQYDPDIWVVEVEDADGVNPFED